MVNKTKAQKVVLYCNMLKSKENAACNMPGGGEGEGGN
jgi:hypothetical protein